MNVDATRKGGPIHFYPTDERPALLANVVEYCVQVGERQPLNRSQADFLVVSGAVSVDGEARAGVADRLPIGAFQVTIRGRNHQVFVHPQLVE